MPNRARRRERTDRGAEYRGPESEYPGSVRPGANDVAFIAAGLLALVLMTGCSFAPSHWVREEGSMKLDMLSASTSELRVETHNGDVRYDATKPGNMNAIEIAYTLHGGGSSDEDAARALQAISIFAEPREDTLVLGWRWDDGRERRWSGRVDFDIVGTPAMPVEVVSHNGDLTVLGPTRTARATTHNGNIRVEAAGAAIEAKSHNGDLILAPAGGTVEASTHNGDITVDFESTGAASGSVETHNGDVSVRTGEATSMVVRFSTRNGSVSGRGTFTKTGSRSWEARYGAAETELRVETYNGDVSIR